MFVNIMKNGLNEEHNENLRTSRSDHGHEYLV